MTNNRKFRIALAEDRDTYRQRMVTYMEEKLGWQCFGFKYAEYLIDWLDGPDVLPPDIIVMDIVFEQEGYKPRASDPKDYFPINGYMATQMIMGKRPEQCIVILTGSKFDPDMSHVIAGFRSGAMDFMVKPGKERPKERPTDEFMAELVSRLEIAYDRKQKDIERNRTLVKAEMAKEEAEIAQRKAEIAQRKAEIAQREAEVAKREAEIAKVQNNITLARGLMHQSGPRLATACFHIEEVKRKVEEERKSVLAGLKEEEQIKSNDVLLGCVDSLSKTSDFIINSVEEAWQNLTSIKNMMKQFNSDSFEQVAGTDEISLLELLKSTLKAAVEQREYLRGDTARFQINIDDRGIAPVVTGSKEWLAEGFMVIFNNAFEAMVEKETGKLAVKLGYEEAEDGRGVKVDISDNGCGISEKDLPLIFEPLFTTKPGRGMGVGLSFAKLVFEANGGFITVKSEETKGTTFSIHLPERGADGDAK
jgi:signal transduction histidine kinase